MQARPAADLVFVSHPVAGVRRIPRAWLDGYGPSGFRPATDAEIRRWEDERTADAPAAPLAPYTPPSAAKTPTAPSAAQLEC